MSQAQSHTNSTFLAELTFICSVKATSTWAAVGPEQSSELSATV
jgi:hypothetical protein